VTRLVLAVYHRLTARRFWAAIAAIPALFWGGHHLWNWGNR